MKLRTPFFVFLGFIVLVAGCEDQTLKAPKAMKSVEINAHTKACLAHGDQADGKVDKVIAKCPACSFAMLGSTKFKTTIEGYEIHSCAAGCNTALEEDANKVFAKLECGKKDRGDSGSPKEDAPEN